MSAFTDEQVGIEIGPVMRQFLAGIDKFEGSGIRVDGARVGTVTLELLRQELVKTMPTRVKRDPFEPARWPEKGASSPAAGEFVCWLFGIRIYAGDFLEGVVYVGCQ